MRSFTLFVFMLFISIQAFSQVILHETFEEGNVNNELLTGWFTGATPKWYAGYGEQSRNRSPHTGDWYAYLPWSSNNWIFKEIALEEGKTYEFSMWYKTDGIVGFQYEVKWGADTFEVNMTNSIQPLTAVNNTDYEQLQDVFIANATGVFYLGIHGVSTSQPWYLCIDDIVLRKIEPYSFTLERLNSDTVAYWGSYYDYTVAITNTGLNNDIYDLNYTSDWDVEFYNESLSNTIGQVAINSLETAIIHIRQYVPSQGVEYGQIQSTLIGVTSQNVYLYEDFTITTTAVAPITAYPFYEGFEVLESFSPGWNTQIIQGNYAFQLVPEGEYPACTPHDNSQGMIQYRSFSSQSGNSALLHSPPLQFEDMEYIVRFWVYRTNNIDNREDKIQVFLSDDMELLDAQLLGEVHRAINFDPVETSNGWFEYSYLFSPGDAVKYIVFKAVSDYGWNMYLDDVKVVKNAADEDPPQFIAIYNTTQYANLPLTLRVVVRDESPGIPTVQGIYDVGNGDKTFELTHVTGKRGDFTFEGTIPSQPDNTNGTVRFIMTDSYGNSATSETFDVHWAGIQPLFEESFENEFPPEGWNVISAPLTWFIWRQVGTDFYEDSDENEFIVSPKHGQKQACVGWDFQGNYQDEWLITPPITISEPADLTFETFAQYGSIWYDYFQVAISTNGINWSVIWDASDQPTGINQYDEMVVLPLDNYEGQTIYIAWHAFNTMYDNFWYSWYIDDVRVERRGPIDAVSLIEKPTFDFKILQNPASNMLCYTLEGAVGESHRMEIFGITGELIKSVRVESYSQGEVQTIYLDNLSAGIYICRATLNSQSVSKRLLIIK